MELFRKNSCETRFLSAILEIKNFQTKLRLPRKLQKESQNNPNKFDTHDIAK